jgi:hypothetical protein
LVLVADKDMEQALRQLLQRPASLDARSKRGAAGVPGRAVASL